MPRADRVRAAESVFRLQRGWDMAKEKKSVRRSCNGISRHVTCYRPQSVVMIDSQSVSREAPGRRRVLSASWPLL